VQELYIPFPSSNETTVNLVKDRALGSFTISLCYSFPQAWLFPFFAIIFRCNKSGSGGGQISPFDRACSVIVQ